MTYTLHNERGDVFEQSVVPVSYLHGHDSGLFEKVERSLEGREAGEMVEVTLTPAEGFGEHNPALTFTDDLENVPPDLRFRGAQLEAQTPTARFSISSSPRSATASSRSTPTTRSPGRPCGFA